MPRNRRRRRRDNLTAMDRRTFVAALPLVGLAGMARAQQGPAPAVAARPGFNFPPPTLPITVVAEGLKFPEAPVHMQDGSVLFVQIESKQVSRLMPDGSVILQLHVRSTPTLDL